MSSEPKQPPGDDGTTRPAPAGTHAAMTAPAPLVARPGGPGGVAGVVDPSNANTPFVPTLPSPASAAATLTNPLIRPAAPPSLQPAGPPAPPPPRGVPAGPLSAAASPAPPVRSSGEFQRPQAGRPGQPTPPYPAHGVSSSPSLSHPQQPVTGSFVAMVQQPDVAATYRQPPPQPMPPPLGFSAGAPASPQRAAPGRAGSPSGAQRATASSSRIPSLGQPAPTGSRSSAAFPAVAGPAASATQRISSSSRLRMQSGAYPAQGDASLSAAAIDEATAPEFVTGLVYALVRAATSYGAGHPQLAAAAQRIVQALPAAFDALRTQTITLVFMDERVYLNRAPIRFNQADAPKLLALGDRMRQVDVSAITFMRGVALDEVLEFASRYAAASSRREPLGPFRSVRIGVGGMASNPGLDELVRSVRGLARYPFLDLYANGLAWATELAQPRRATTLADLAGAKRIVGQMIDALGADRSGLLGLLQLRPFAGSVQNRRIDTTIVAVGLALRAGIGDFNALELGVCTLVRPLPRSRGPWWARQALRRSQAGQVAGTATTALAAITAFESSGQLGPAISEDFYGNPTYKHVATQLVEAAEAYVDFLQPSDNTEFCTSEIAMIAMVAQAGRVFDADIVRELVGLLGFFAPASPVRLNSGDLAVVTDVPPNGADPRRPTVRPFGDTSGQTFVLSRPELQPYSIETSVQVAACPYNPLYDFLR